jgi:hypothetical protein
MGSRHYIPIPGAGAHELPPLLVHGNPPSPPLDEVVAHAAEIIETEELIPSGQAGEPSAEQRKFELAIQLTESYLRLVSHWNWGDSIIGWIRQCEITFESHEALRALLAPDIWPHAGRSSFVTLLRDKAVSTPGIGLEQAVGLRLTFRQPPPIGCFSDEFLFCLNSPVASSAYRSWAAMGRADAGLLPPERFYFQVLKLDSE